MPRSRLGLAGNFIDLLVSVRLTLFVLSVLGVVCALGTLVPLTSSYADFRRFLIGGLGRAMIGLGLDRPFQSTIFRSLLFLLALNLLFCTFRHLFRLLRQGGFPGAGGKAGFFDGARFRASGIFDGTADEAAAVLARFGYGKVRGGGRSGASEKGVQPGVASVDCGSDTGAGTSANKAGSVATACRGNETCSRPGDEVIALERHSLAPFGPHVTHIGILLLFAGAAAGWYYGYEGSARASVGSSFPVYEGEYYRLKKRLAHIAYLQDFYRDLQAENVLRRDDVRSFDELGKEASDIHRRMNLLEGAPRFSVKIVDAREERYDGSGDVKDWISSLAVMREGRVLASGTIEVNRPFTFGGLTFYQHSFGSGPSAVSTSVPVTLVRLTGGKPVRLDDLGLGLEVVDFYPDFAVDTGGRDGPRAFSRSSELKNPVLRLKVIEDGGQVSEPFLFQGPPWAIHANPSGRFETRLTRVVPDGDGYAFEITVLERKLVPWTGLSFQYDPGTLLVWIGSVLIVLGMFLSFFCEHRRVWLRKRIDGRLDMSAVPARFPERFEAEFDGMARALGLVRTSTAR